VRWLPVIEHKGKFAHTNIDYTVKVVVTPGNALSQVIFISFSPGIFVAYKARVNWSSIWTLVEAPQPSNLSMLAAALVYVKFKTELN